MPTSRGRDAYHGEHLISRFRQPNVQTDVSISTGTMEHTDARWCLRAVNDQNQEWWNQEWWSGVDLAAVERIVKGWEDFERKIGSTELTWRDA